jgi:hypothetical protein
MAKSRVIEQLLGGQIDLLEAAAWFRYLNETPEECPGESLETWPGTEPEEKLCRQVIEYATARIRHLGPESEVEKLVHRLERQLADILERPGGLVLPSL